MPTYFSVWEKFSSQLNLTPSNPFMAAAAGGAAARRWKSATIAAMRSNNASFPSPRASTWRSMRSCGRRAILTATSTVSPGPSMASAPSCSRTSTTPR